MEEEEKKSGRDGRESASPLPIFWPRTARAMSGANVQHSCFHLVVTALRHFCPSSSHSLTHSLAPSLSLDVQRRVRDWVRLFADSIARSAPFLVAAEINLVPVG